MLTHDDDRADQLSERDDAAGGYVIHARASAGTATRATPPVVLVHGLLVSSRHMLPLARQLIPTFPVYVPDLPGWGRSSKPPRALGVPELADALAAWLDAVGLERPVLVANSFGCQVVADLAARHPDRVALVVLLGPTVDPQARSLWRIAGRWLLNLPLEPIGLHLVALRDLWDMGPRRLAGSIRAMLDDRIEEKLPWVAAPTLVVRGSRDTTVPVRWAAAAASLLPKGRSVQIRGAAHTINYNSPEAVARVVRAFVDAWMPTLAAPADAALAPVSA